MDCYIHTPVRAWRSIDLAAVLSVQNLVWYDKVLEEFESKGEGGLNREKGSGEIRGNYPAAGVRGRGQTLRREVSYESKLISSYTMYEVLNEGLMECGRE